MHRMHRNVIQGVSKSNLPWVSITPCLRKEVNCFGYIFFKWSYFAWSWDLIIFTHSSRHLPGDPFEAANITTKKDGKPSGQSLTLPPSHLLDRKSLGLHIFLLLLLRFFQFISSDLGFCHVVYRLEKMRIRRWLWRGAGGGTQLTPAHTTMGLIGCSRLFDFGVNVCCDCLKPRPLLSFKKKVVQTKRSLICWVNLLDIGVKH